MCPGLAEEALGYVMGEVFQVFYANSISWQEAQNWGVEVRTIV